MSLAKEIIPEIKHHFKQAANSLKMVALGAVILILAYTVLRKALKAQIVKNRLRGSK